MTVDLAVATPAFLDLTFVGLERDPGPGEERFAGDLHALARRGGDHRDRRRAPRACGRCWPRRSARTSRATWSAAALEREGVQVLSRRGARTATTVVLPVNGSARS